MFRVFELFFLIDNVCAQDRFDRVKAELTGDVGKVAWEFSDNSVILDGTELKAFMTIVPVYMRDEGLRGSKALSTGKSNRR